MPVAVGSIRAGLCKVAGTIVLREAFGRTTIDSVLQGDECPYGFLRQAYCERCRVAWHDVCAVLRVQSLYNVEVNIAKLCYLPHVHIACDEYRVCCERITLCQKQVV